MKTTRMVAVFVLLLGLQTTGEPPQAPQAPQAINCQPGQDLITVPEIKSENGRLRAEMVLTSGKRTLWGSTGDTRCVQQDLRYFKGRNLLKPEPEDPAFSKGEPIPGPTLRARVGDLIEVKFLNQVDTQSFASTLDQANTNPANTTGCDEARSESGLIYPNAAAGDVMPNCLHGSSTSNIHFHGTHTTPGTTGDNVLLFVTPALRGGRDRKLIRPLDAFVDKQFAQIWSACEANGSPTKWQELPLAWRADQALLLKEYDRTASYRGQPGKLPHDMQLWPANEAQIAAGVWPQYQLGASPYCFRLADYKQVDGKPSHVMGQAPGTHWYHAHKHGSTALNVANGMTGAFIIEGQYDDDLRRFYGSDLRDQVLIDPAGAPRPEAPVVLLTVTVGDAPVSPAKDFIQTEADFPAFPAFLKDIADAEIAQRRTVDFGAGHNTIDGKTFDGTRYSQVMELNDAEEWKITNQAGDKAHPFHIHINPFQITEVFQPNLENTKNPSQPCYVDPLNPQTWKPCTPLTGPFVWWDTFAIPASAPIDIPKTCTTIDKCPAPILSYTACTPATVNPPKDATCTVTIPGYFKMRTRFVDYTGAYVIHCHILIHEDRGMMQLVEVVPDRPVYTHK